MQPRDRLYRTHALILRRRDQGDADRILTLYSPEHGKLEVIAKGVRKTTSRKAGHLELFTHVMLLMAQARTWDIVSEVTTVESFRHLRNDLDAIGRASYVCELLDAFAESDDENGPLWELVLMILRTLDQSATPETPTDPGLLMRWFELRLLGITGFQPQIFQCVECQEPLQPIVNYLSIEEGGVFCPKCGQGREHLEALEPDVLKILRFLQSRPWNEVAPLQVRPMIQRRVENILQRFLLNILERRLRSVDFLRKLQAM
ncbi:MAG: DNA repair protein RecO [Caldilineaceae bacterium]